MYNTYRMNDFMINPTLTWCLLQISQLPFKKFPDLIYLVTNCTNYGVFFFQGEEGEDDDGGDDDDE